MAERTYQIAVIPGDGIGTEVVERRLQDVVDEAQRGALMTVLGVGLLIGGGLAQFLSHALPRGLMIILGAVASGISMLLIPQFQTATPVAISLGASGIFGGLMSTLLPAAIQQGTVDHARGRVMSIYNIIFQTSVAVAAVGLSHLSKYTSPGFAFQAGGWFIVTGALACLLVKPLRELK